MLHATLPSLAVHAASTSEHGACGTKNNILSGVSLDIKIKQSLNC